MRSSIVYRNIILSSFIKGGSILVSFLLIPLTLDYIDNKEFGIWMTINSLTLWFSLIDVSFGNGLRNQLVKNFAEQDMHSARNYVSTLYAFLFIGAIGICIILLICNYVIDWSFMFQTGSAQQSDIKQIISIVFISFCIQITLKPINSILLADQRTSMSSLLVLSGNILTLGGIFIASITIPGSLLILVLIQSTAPVLVLIIANILLFTNKYKSILPSVQHINFKNSRKLFSNGSQFLFLQVVSLLVFSSGNLIVSYLLGTDYVSVYSIASRYFGIIPLLYGIVITPYWSAFTDAYVTNDLSWINQTLAKLNKMSLFFALVTIIMFLFSQTAYAYWIGSRIIIPDSLSLAFVFYSISYVFLSNYNYLINGIGKLRVLVIVSAVGSVLFIPLNYLIVIKLQYGLSGIVWISTFWNILLTFICRTQANRLLNNRLKGIWNL